MNVFKSPAAQAHLLSHLPTFKARVLAPSIDEREVQTQFGRTHVSMAGPADAPPLVAIHGAMASSFHLLAELGPLPKTRRVIVLDVLGQSPLSEDARLPLTQAAAGAWVTEVMNQLNIPQADLLGVSWGGFFASRAAAAHPERFKSLTLLVPSGYVDGPAFEAMWRLALPMFGWRVFAHEPSLRRMTAALFTTQDEAWVQWLGACMQSFNTQLVAPPLANDTELSAWRGRTLVVAAESDLSFPGEALLERVRALHPGVETELVKGARHAPPFTDEFRAWLAGRIEGFLGGR